VHPLGRHLLECLSAQLTLPLDGFYLHGEVATLDVDPSGSAVPAKDNLPLSVIFVLFPAFGTDALLRIAVVMSLQERLVRLPLVGCAATTTFLPVCVFLRHVDTEPLHLFHIILSVVAKGTFEKVSRGVCEPLNAGFVKPLVAAWRPDVGKVVFAIVDVIVADATAEFPLLLVVILCAFDGFSEWSLLGAVFVTVEAELVAVLQERPGPNSAWQVKGFTARFVCASHSGVLLVANVTF